MSVELHFTNNDYPAKRYAVEQGASWKKVTILHERNLMGWAVRGEIRDDFKEKGGVLIAAFTFEPIEYKAVVVCDISRMRSLIVPSLSVATTKAMGEAWVARKMVQRRAMSDVPQIGRNAWVYDIEVQSGEEVIRVLQGYLEVSLEVTG